MPLRKNGWLLRKVYKDKARLFRRGLGRERKLFPDYQLFETAARSFGLPNVSRALESEIKSKRISKEFGETLINGMLIKTVDILTSSPDAIKLAINNKKIPFEKKILNEFIISFGENKDPHTGNIIFLVTNGKVVELMVKEKKK
jgi:hypothetical protein